MDLVGEGADAFLQLADDQSMNVFVAGSREEIWSARFGAHLFKRLDDGAALIGRQDPDAFQGAREGLGAADVGVNQAAVEMKRARESFEDLRRPGFKPSAPELHGFLAAFEAAFCAACKPARTLIGSPIRLMKPSAS